MAESHRLRIDLAARTVEAEGSAEFVSSVYSDFKNLLTTTSETAQSNRPPVAVENTAGEGAGDHELSKARRKVRTQLQRSGSDRVSQYSPSLDADLATKSLKSFYARYKPRSHSDKIAIFVYYLEGEHSAKPATGDQIFTCYRALGERVPEAFVQALRDASKKHGYVNYKSPHDVTLTVRGRNHVEHDMPRADEKVV